PPGASRVPGASGPYLPDSYFRIRPDATISIARLTLSDSDRRSNWASRYRNFAPGGRRVTAGDGNMVPVGPYGTSPTRSPWSTRQHKRRRIAALVQEERPRTCPHVHQKPSRC